MSRIPLLFLTILTVSGCTLAAPSTQSFLINGEESLSLNGSWKFKTAGRELAPESGDIVIDNADKSQVEVVGSGWTESQWKEGGSFWGDNYLVATKRSTNVPAWVIFKPTVPKAATYEVFGTWTRGQRDKAAQVTIQFHGGSKTVQIDQSKRNTRWTSLGRFPFAPNAGNSIKVDASGAGAQVVADAFLLRPVEGEKTDSSEPDELYSSKIDDSNWDQMAVPGNWDTTNKYAHYTGEAWYRRSFSPSAAWKGSPVRLRFDAVYHDATVYLNGKLLGEHSGGYTPFEFDVTNILRYGEANILAVKADNSYRRGAWWSWGGISRPVQLIRNNEVRIVRQQLRTEPDLKNGKADVFVRLTIQNEANSEREVKLNTQMALRGSSQKGWTAAQAPELATSLRLPANSQKIVEVRTTLPAERVKLWHFDHPYLYDAQTTATVNGRLQHLSRARFGIRKIEVLKTQLLLNGEPVRLGGFNRVHDHRAWGNTEPEHLIRQDVDMMKRLGGNLTRIMHGPQSPALLDYMDEKGILVFEEIPIWGSDDPTQREKDNLTTRRWLREMIERDYNHPSIIGWSVGNEITGHYDYVKSMIDYVRSDLDSHRLLGYASYSGVWKNFGPKNDPITFSDLTMHNYYGSLSEMAGTLRERWPDKAIFATEFGSSQIGASLDSKLRNFEVNLDNVRKSHPEVIGISLWTFNDYRSPYRDSALSEDRTWGLVDSWRQHKRAFEQVAAQFSPIRSLSLQDVTTNQGTIRLEPRATVDFPSYILRDYELKWELRRKDGTIADGGTLSLPEIKPGDAALTRPVVWKMPATPVVDLVLSIIAPSGYVVHETRVALDVPEKPQISAVITGNGAARIFFKPVAGASEYKVLYGLPNQKPQESKNSIASEITVNGLTNGTNYQFSVVALNDKGASQASETLISSPKEQALPPIISKAVPSDGGFIVGYEVEKEDRSFTIEYDTEPQRFRHSLKGLTVKGAIAVNGLRNGTTYYFRLKREGDYGTSAWSQTLSVTPNGQQPPTTPKILGAVRGKGQVSLRFEPSEQAISYRIRYSKTGGTAVIKDVSAAAVNQATVTGLDDAQPYTLSISAVGAGGISPFSESVIVSTGK